MPQVRPSAAKYFFFKNLFQHTSQKKTKNKLKSPQSLPCMQVYFPPSERNCVCMSDPIFCNPISYSPPDSTVHGILQARILEWVAVTSSSGSFQCRDQTHISYISCTGRQFLYHWSGFLFLLQRIFPTQGLNPCLLHWQVDSLSLSHQFSSVAQSCPTLRLHAYSTPWLSCPSPTPRAC